MIIVAYRILKHYNTMKSTLKIFPFLFLMRGVIGVDEDRLKSESVMEGDSVTLNPVLTQIQGIILIQWGFGDNGPVIAEAVGNEISYPHLTEIFRGRLQLNHLTGSLTINNMRTKHSGHYQLKIDHSTGTLWMIFSVTVYYSPPVIDFEMKSVMWGGPVILQTDVTEAHGNELIVWRFGVEGKLIAKRDIETKSSTLYETDERFKGRLKLNDQTGSLIINNTRTTDSELYTVKISSSSKQTIYKRFNVSVNVSDKPNPDPGLSSVSNQPNPDPGMSSAVTGLSPGAVAGIVVVLLLVFAAAVCFFYYQHKQRQMGTEGMNQRLFQWHC